ncbi:MAG: aldehyde dehydrogenase family protein, partial [Bacteroidia bacterium]|nr:aldehyde dehydrogenase family protein [Bacteroidia bacterium]
MEIYPLYCGGEFITTNQTLPVINPFTQQAFAQTCLANSEHINKAIEDGLKSLQPLKELPVYKRVEILNFIVKNITEQRNEFAVLIAQESAKPLKFALAEVDRAIQTFLIAAEETKHWPGEVIRLDLTPSGKNKECIVSYFPIGLIAGISPFNFPLNLAVHKIAPAIAAACPIILKPASKTPLSTLKLAKIIHQSDLPKGAFSVLPCNRQTGQLLVEDDRIKMLSFTGSLEVGWSLKSKSGKKKVVLELGGNAGLIIAKSADIIKAAEKAAVGAFSYSGQVCIHTQRILVDTDLYDKFISLFIEKIKAFKLGDPLLSDTDISTMIDESNVLRIDDWITESIDNGAKLIIGGKKEKNIYLPTVLTNTQPQHKVNCEEVFGPVVTVERFTDFKEAVNCINQSKFG